MTTKTFIIIAALALAVSAPVYSAEKEARKKGPDGAQGRPGARGFQGNLDELNLTDEQKSKVEAFQQEQREKFQGLRDAAPEERREKMQKLQEASTAKMKEVLTPEQFAKWEKSRAAGAGGAPGLAGGRERMQKMMDELNLNEDQKEKVRAAMQEQGQGLRDVSPEERREKFQKSQEKMTAKMKEILTKEQFEKWEKSRGEIGGRLGGRPGGPGAAGTPSDAPAKRPEQK